MSSKTSTYASDDVPNSPQQTYDPNPPTIAAFSPHTLSGASATHRQRSTVIVHKKSPLLVATPPQITRALAYSHPFLLPLNRLAGLLSWSTDDPWESFLLVAAFWGTVLYGGNIIRYAGPVIIVVGLILGMYSRRYSPLSSTSSTGEKHEKGRKRSDSEASSKHHKSLDEIVETLREFTTRCNILLDPFLRLTDFLSTQRTPTSATTRPALTSLFIRILLVTPLWIGLTLPPLYILTTRRVILAIGTVVLTWHSRPARVARVILWRSVLMRRASSFVTGLDFPISDSTVASAQSSRPSAGPRRPSQIDLAAKTAASAITTTPNQKRRATSPGVRFTFILYENQRRWIGLGWTTSLFAYERGPWSDEHLNPASTKDEFELPEVDNGVARWRWVEGSQWRIEHGDKSENPATPMKGHQRDISTASSKSDSGAGDGGGWIYYDNKWQEGRREDGWGRYTRRRKWYRDAELVEVTPSTEVTPAVTPVVNQSEAEEDLQPPEKPARPNIGSRTPSSHPATTTTATQAGDEASIKQRKAWFSGRSATPNPSTPNSNGQMDGDDGSGSGSVSRPGRHRSDSNMSSGRNTGHFSGRSDRSRDDPEDDSYQPWRDRARQSVASGGGGSWGAGDDVAMGLS